MVGINTSVALSLLGGSSTNATGLDASLLTAWAAAKAGLGADVAAATQDPNAPLAPVWTPGVSPSAEALVQRALTNRPFFDTGAKLYSDLGATGDYRRLFALYSGLTTLQALAGRAEDASLTSTQQSQTAAQFARGLTELEAFFSREQFDDIRLAQGDRVDAAQSTLALAQSAEDYTTGIIHRGGVYQTVSGLAADAEFNIVATSAGGTVRNVAIDLAQMGSIPRTLSNVVSFINTTLSAAGAASRIEIVDKTPKTNTIVIGGQAVERPYTGAKQYALKVDVRAGEKVAFNPVAPAAAFYALGSAGAGARLIKLEDVGGAAGQPVWLERPIATTDPVGGHVASGWLGPGVPYQSAPADAYEQRSNALVSDGANGVEDLLRTAGEAVLKLDLADGRVITVSTAWRSDDLESWRARAGESEDRALIDDLAERLTQLLHEQGVAAGFDVWEDDGELGLSLFTADGVGASSLAISGRPVRFEGIEQPGMVGGLREGIFARRFEAAGVAATGELFVGAQTVVVTTSTGARTFSFDGGEDGVDATTLAGQINEALRAANVQAAASFIDDGGVLKLRLDALHSVAAISATLNGEAHAGDLQAPGAWASGGLPTALPGQPFGDARRVYQAGSAPLLAHPGAFDVEIVVDTPAGARTITVAISAQDRLDYPDAGPGELNAVLKARIDEALNAAGVYVSADAADLAQWTVAEGAGQRIASINVNGDPLTLAAASPAYGLGGAFSAERSFTGAAAATGVGDDLAALLGDPTMSITFDTPWGVRTVTASLAPGDPRTLESAALRLNEALAAAGYDLGVAAVALSGGGASLRAVAGSTHSVRAVSEVTLGAMVHGFTLDPIDSVSHADDPVGALRVAVRAARGAAVTESVPSASTFVAPSANASGWFPGRAFDIAVGGGAAVATARAVATAADGSVYVLADLSGDSAALAIKGARDVALLKYNSAGQLQFTEVLGAAQAASGFSLAVSADGRRVAVAGAVEGALSNAAADKGGADSFVTMFDKDGKELWTARRGGAANDEARAIAFAADGSLYVAGTTEAALGSQIALGAADAYVRGYSAAGVELFTRQFGTGGTDAATALLVRGDVAGGVEIVTGGVENNRGVVRRFTYSTNAGIATGASRDIGYFYQGAINGLAADGASLYVGGAVGADRLTLGAPARGAVAGKEGFVARLDVGLVSTALDRTTYLGSAQDDAVTGLAIVDGAVYAAGSSGGVIAGAGAPKSSAGFLSRLDENGDAAWTRAFSSSAGAVTLTGLAVDASGASPLDILGLPRGELNARSDGKLVQRSALRVDDEFEIGVSGRRLTTIRVGADDTLASLVVSMNRAIGSAGRAEIVGENGVERIKITAREGRAVALDAGRPGRDALGALGLVQGVIAQNGSGRGALKTYGLGLIAADLKLDTPARIASAKAELSAAVSIVRQAYEHLLNPNAKELTAAEKALAARRDSAGPAPEYYQTQLANYQAALARLGG